MGDSIPSEEHIRHCMLFHFRAGKSATATTKIICEVYGEVLKVNKCQRWFRKFTEGNFDLNNAPRSGRPVEFDNDALKSMVESDPRLSIEELSTSLGSTWSTVQRHLNLLGKVYRQGIWIPHMLSDKNKDQRRTICTSLLTRLQGEQFFNRVVTGDEKWILYSNLKRTKQWLSPNERPLPTPKPNLSMKKVLLCVWWDISGILYYELLKPGDTVTAEVYCRQLDDLHSQIQKKRPALVSRKGVILQHDNARPHAARITQEKIQQLNWEVLPHPPYSPDIAPSDYHLFRSLEHSLKNKSFKSITDIETHLNFFFASKPKTFFTEGIENLQKRWRTVVENDGDYILD